MQYILTSNFKDSEEALKTYLPEQKNSLVAFIPTAADIYEDKKFVIDDRNKLIELGYKVEDIDLKNINKFEIKNILSKFNIIFVAGGNTFYLLDWVRKSGFDTFIKSKSNSNLIYIGSSAGTILLGPTIEYVNKFDDPNKAPDLQDFSGLGMIDFLVLPHYGKEKYLEKIGQVIDEWQNKGYKIQTLRDNQAIFIDKDGKNTLVESK